MACDWLFSLGILFQIYKGMKYKPPIFLKLKVLVPLSCLTLWDPMDYSRPGSSGHGILQARILECVAISFSRGTSQSRDWTQVLCIAGRFFITWDIREVHLLNRRYSTTWSKAAIWGWFQYSFRNWRFDYLSEGWFWGPGQRQTGVL